ncbi:MAG: hypothetical protein ABL932_23500 [Terricaulis sp.]
MKPRVTVCTRADGTFEILLNEAGRDLMVKELQRLDRSWDHFHLDYYVDPDIADGTDVVLSSIPYRDDDTVLENGKVLLRPDDWDQQYFPHVVGSAGDGQ